MKCISADINLYNNTVPAWKAGAIFLNNVIFFLRRHEFISHMGKQFEHHSTVVPNRMKYSSVPTVFHPLMPELKDSCTWKPLNNSHLYLSVWCFEHHNTWQVYQMTGTKGLNTSSIMPNRSLNPCMNLFTSCSTSVFIPRNSTVKVICCRQT
jgi:hypothetical protein